METCMHCSTYSNEREGICVLKGFCSRMNKLETFRCTSREHEPVWGSASGSDLHRSIFHFYFSCR